MYNIAYIKATKNINSLLKNNNYLLKTYTFNIGSIHNLVPYVYFSSQFGPLCFKTSMLVPYVLTLPLIGPFRQFFLTPLIFDTWLSLIFDKCTPRVKN
jgi:hypothetical protein